MGKNIIQNDLLKFFHNKSMASQIVDKNLSSNSLSEFVITKSKDFKLSFTDSICEQLKSLERQGGKEAVAFLREFEYKLIKEIENNKNSKEIIHDLEKSFKKHDLYEYIKFIAYNRIWTIDFNHSLRYNNPWQEENYLKYEADITFKVSDDVLNEREWPCEIKSHVVRTLEKYFHSKIELINSDYKYNGSSRYWTYIIRSGTLLHKEVREFLLSVDINRCVKYVSRPSEHILCRCSLKQVKNTGVCIVHERKEF